MLRSGHQLHVNADHPVGHRQHAQRLQPTNGNAPPRAFPTHRGFHRALSGGESSGSTSPLQASAGGHGRDHHFARFLSPNGTIESVSDRRCNPGPALPPRTCDYMPVVALSIALKGTAPVKPAYTRPFLPPSLCPSGALPVLCNLPHVASTGALAGDMTMFTFNSPLNCGSAIASPAHCAMVPPVATPLVATGPATAMANDHCAHVVQQQQQQQLLAAQQLANGCGLVLDQDQPWRLTAAPEEYVIAKKSPLVHGVQESICRDDRDFTPFPLDELTWVPATRDDIIHLCEIGLGAADPASHLQIHRVVDRPVANVKTTNHRNGRQTVSVRQTERPLVECARNEPIASLCVERSAPADWAYFGDENAAEFADANDIRPGCIALVPRSWVSGSPAAAAPDEAVTSYVHASHLWHGHNNNNSNNNNANSSVVNMPNASLPLGASPPTKWCLSLERVFISAAELTSGVISPFKVVRLVAEEGTNTARALPCYDEDFSFVVPSTVGGVNAEDVEWWMR